MERTRYAPMDWIYSRPHGKVIADAARDSHKPIRSDADLMGGHTIIDRLMPYMDSPGENPVMGCFRYSVDQLGDEAEPRDDLDLRWEAQTLSDIMAWCRAGRQVFRFDATMTDSLRNIDFGEATVGDVSHPYESYYLVHDGPRHTLPNGAVLDGIMVTSRMMPPKDADRAALARKVVDRPLAEGVSADKLLQRAHAEISTVPVLTLTFMPRGYALWPEARVHGYTYELELTNPAMPLRQGLLDAVASFDAAGNVQYEAIPDLADWVDLAMNSALYLTRYDAGREQWQSEAPNHLVAGAEAGRKSPQRELARLGFARTRLVRFGGDDDGGAGGAAVRDGVRPHWRRGHWRNQPHGPRNGLRKLVLVRPARIGWDRGASDPTPDVRVYEVASPVPTGAEE